MYLQKKKNKKKTPINVAATVNTIALSLHKQTAGVQMSGCENRTTIKKKTI